MELKLNYVKMDCKPAGETWEWYTAEIGKIGCIHIHNHTPSGKWAYRIRTTYEINSRVDFPDRDAAYVAAVKVFRRITTEAIEILSNGNGH